MVIDGMNVAKTFGRGKFLIEGLQKVKNYMEHRTHKIVIILPQHCFKENRDNLNEDALKIQ